MRSGQRVSQNKSADLKLGKPLTMITRLSRIQKQNKSPFFVGYVLINVGKHTQTESLIKKHFKRKHFSEICSVQILTHMQNMPSSNGSSGKLELLSLNK